MKARPVVVGAWLVAGRNSRLSDCELRFLLYVVLRAARRGTTSCVSRFEP